MTASNEVIDLTLSSSEEEKEEEQNDEQYDEQHYHADVETQDSRNTCNYDADDEPTLSQSQESTQSTVAVATVTPADSRKRVSFDDNSDARKRLKSVPEEDEMDSDIDSVSSAKPAVNPSSHEENKDDESSDYKFDEEDYDVMESQSKFLQRLRVQEQEHAMEHLTDEAETSINDDNGRASNGNGGAASNRTNRTYELNSDSDDGIKEEREKPTNEVTAAAREENRRRLEKYFGCNYDSDSDDDILNQPPAFPKQSKRTASGTPSNKTSSKPNPATVDEVFSDLNNEQLQAVKHILDGDNTSVSGMGGTGKTRMVDRFVYEASLNAHLFKTKKKVMVVCPTNIACLMYNEFTPTQTLNKFGGFAVPKTVKELFEAMQRNPDLARKMGSYDILIFDECGAIDACLFDWFDQCMRRVRKKPDLPMGGIQVVFVGDLGQLAPIGGMRTKETVLAEMKKVPKDPAMHLFNCRPMNGSIFQTAFYREAGFKHVHLVRNYRQDNKDPPGVTYPTKYKSGKPQPNRRQLKEDFLQFQKDIRVGKVFSSAVKRTLEHVSLSYEERGVVLPPDVKPTELYGYRKDVKKANAKGLAACPDELAEFYDSINDVFVDKRCNVEPDQQASAEAVLWKCDLFCSDRPRLEGELPLKTKAQVIVSTPFTVGSNKIVTGRRGVVTGFEEFPVIEPVEGKTTDLDERIVPSSEFDMFLLACNVPTLGDLPIGHKVMYQGKEHKVTKVKKIPKVRFCDGFGNGGSYEILVFPIDVEEITEGKGRSVRRQLPLRHAWALTVHAVQGMEVDYLVVDMANFFSKGHAYSAVSRVKTVDGLQVRNYSRDKVKVDQLVILHEQASKDGDDAMTKFLTEEAGIWWYDILPDPRFAKLLMAPMADNGYYTKIFRSWLTKYYPKENYNGSRNDFDKDNRLMSSYWKHHWKLDSLERSTTGLYDTITDEVRGTNERNVTTDPTEIVRPSSTVHTTVRNESTELSTTVRPTTGVRTTVPVNTNIAVPGNDSNKYGPARYNDIGM